jgi:F0F1-type ATP synthase assembly protein I
MAILAAIWGAVQSAQLAQATALSALLGGAVNIIAVVVYAVVLRISNPTSAGGTIAAVFRAEAIKILVIIVQLALVLTTYKDVVPVAFLATFVITVLLFRMAFFDRD